MKRKSLGIIFAMVLGMMMSLPVYADDDAEVVAENAKAEVSSDISTEKTTAAYAEASDGGNASIEVKGDVDVHCEESEGQNVKGVETQASGSGSSADISVEGDITVSGKESLSTAIFSEVEQDGAASVNVGGDVSVEGDGVIGVLADTDSGGTLNINVDGDVSTRVPNEHMTNCGISLGACDEGSSTNARIGGDIKGENLSIDMELEAAQSSEINVVAEGTLSAGSDATIAVVRGGGDLSITIWKAEADKDGDIVKEEVAVNNGNSFQSTDFSKEVESSIHYIIKVDPNQEIGLEGTEEIFYVAPDGTTRTYDTAKENDRVAVKLNIPDGYELKGAYCDEDRQVALYQDESGYYLLVPKGGGVYVNVWMEWKGHTNKHKDPVVKDADQMTLSSAMVLPKEWFDLDETNLVAFPQDGCNCFAVDYSILSSYWDQGAIDLTIRGSSGNKWQISIEELFSLGNDRFIFVRKGNTLELYVGGERVKVYDVVKREQNYLEKESMSIITPWMSDVKPFPYVRGGSTGQEDLIMD